MPDIRSGTRAPVLRIACLTEHFHGTGIARAMPPVRVPTHLMTTYHPITVGMTAPTRHNAFASAIFQISFTRAQLRFGSALVCNLSVIGPTLHRAT